MRLRLALCLVATCNTDSFSSDSGTSDAAVESGDAATQPFCAAHPGALFCADWDESADAAAGWLNAVSLGGGTTAVDSVSSVSSPSSLLAKAPPLASSSSTARGSVRTTLTGTTKVTVDIDVSAASDAPFVDVLTLAVPVVGYQAYIQLSPSTTGFDVKLIVDLLDLDAGVSAQCALGTKLPNATWGHFTLSMTPSTVTLTGDASTTCSLPIATAISTADPTTVVVGVVFMTGPSSADTNVHIDNVRVHSP